MENLDKIFVLETMDSFKTFEFDGSFVNNQKIMSVPLKHKGFEIPNPKRDYTGSKVYQEFRFGAYLAVKINYTDVKEDGKIIKIQKVCDYYNTDETIFCSKTEFDIVRNEDKLKRSRYDASYSHLKETAKGTVIEGNVNTILNHYYKQVSIWLLGDPSSCLDAINSENNPVINGHLNTEINPSGKKVKDSIIEQLTGVEWTPLEE